MLGWRDAYPTIETSAAATSHAIGLASDHGLTIWDAVIVAASAEAECRLLLSEGLQDGFTRGGVTVTNPFVASPSPSFGGDDRGVRPAFLRLVESSLFTRLVHSICKENGE